MGKDWSNKSPWYGRSEIEDAIDVYTNTKPYEPSLKGVSMKRLFCRCGHEFRFVGKRHVCACGGVITVQGDIVTCYNDGYVSMIGPWKEPKGVTMFKRTFEVPQKPREVVKSCGNCSSWQRGDDADGICRKNPTSIHEIYNQDAWCEQHTINQDLFKDEMPEGEVVR